MNTKLVLVEGLPGFGKSTTANLLNTILLEKKTDVELFLEGNLDHPADYDGVSCFNKSEFDSLLVKSGAFREVISNSVTRKEDHYFLPYRKMIDENGVHFPESLLNTIFKNDIYELPFEKNMELITEKWRDFVNQANKGSKTYIFECCFIQNPITIGMVKYGEDKEKVINYVRALEKIIEELNPVLFYIEQDNLEFSFRKVYKEREKEWSTGFMNYYTNQGYGEYKGYKGLEGTMKVLEARREVEREIFDQLSIKKAILNNTFYETTRYKSMIKEK